MTARIEATELRRAVCEVDTSALPSEILVVPWGNVKSESGDFIFDDQAAAAVIKVFTAHGVDVPIDWEHQTLGAQYSSPDGRAPAAGWITVLRAVRGAGLFARVGWTSQARADLADRRYRYLSPVVLVRKGDGRAVELHSVALTNKPAIAGMAPVVNKNGNPTQGNAMDNYQRIMDALRALCGLDASATEQAVLDAVRAAFETGSTAASAARLPDLTRFVARADYDTACKRATDAEQTMLAMKADAFIDEGKRTGKISEAGKAMWLRAFSANPEQARVDLESAPVVCPPDGRVIRANATAGLLAVHGRDRRAIIGSAAREYDTELGLHQLVGRMEFVNGELVQAGLPVLSKQEAAEVAV